MSTIAGIHQQFLSEVICRSEMISNYRGFWSIYGNIIFSCCDLLGFEEWRGVARGGHKVARSISVA